MEQNMQFRSAGFGGFNRQDVLNYIEETTKEYNQKLEELRAQCEGAQEEAEELRQSLDKCKTQSQTMQERMVELIEEKEALLARVKKLEPLQAQVTLLHSRVEALTPDAEAYAGLRNQISDIELEARQRAGEILAQAKQKAEEITTNAQSQADALRTQTETETEQLRRDTETAVEEQLSQARAQAEDIVAQANQTAADATNQAQQQLEAEQERVQDLRSKTQSAFAETGAVVRSIVVNSVAEIERIKDALLSLKTTYSQAQDDLTPEEPTETPEEPTDE